MSSASCSSPDSGARALGWSPGWCSPASGSGGAVTRLLKGFGARLRRQSQRMQVEFGGLSGRQPGLPRHERLVAGQFLDREARQRPRFVGTSRLHLPLSGHDLQRSVDAGGQLQVGDSSRLAPAHNTATLWARSPVAPSGHHRVNECR